MRGCAARRGRYGDLSEADESRARQRERWRRLTVICRREGFRFEGHRRIDGRRLATEMQR